MEKAILVVPVERPRRSRQHIKAAPWGMSRAPITKQYCFNTDTYRTGQAIKMSHHTGEVAKGIISECTKDWIKVYIVDQSGNCLIREIELEDYIAGSWIVELL